MTLRDWGQEKKEADEIGNRTWFKPEADVEYIVKFLDEGGPEIPKTFEDRDLIQIEFKVEVTDEQDVKLEYTWTITKGGKDSCYGKLTNIFAEAGHSTGVVVLVTAVGDGKSRRYLVKKPRNIGGASAPSSPGVLGDAVWSG